MLSCLGSAPAFFFTLRRSTHGRLSMPFAGGRIELFQDLTAAALAEDIAPLLAQCHPEDASLILTGLERSARTMTPCRTRFRIATVDRGKIVLEMNATPQPVEAESGAVEWHGFMHDITERSRVEHQQHEREAFLGTLLDTIPAPVFYKDRSGTYLGFNKAYEDFFGTTRTNLLGKTVFDIAPRELAEQFHTQDEALYAAGGAQQYESLVKNAQGTARNVAFNKAVFADADGQPAGLIGILTDITERKHAELHINETRNRLHSVLKTIPDLVWLKDANGAYLACNHAFERFFGSCEAEIVGKTDYDFVSSELADFFRQKDREAIAAGTICINEEWVNFAGSGEPTLLETRKLPVLGPDGEVTGVLGVARNITERKRIEESLSQSEIAFRTLVENTPDTVARFAPDFRRLYANPSLGKLLEVKPDALIGLKPSTIPGGIAGSMAEDKLAEVFASGAPQEFNYELTRSDGSGICCLINMTPEFNSAGEVQTVLAVGRDITELNAFRQKIHQMAFYDTLTTLPNRALFTDRLHQTITDASWHAQLAGVMVIDMDHFKAVNDTMGHAVGDELLRQTALRLMDCVRGYDTVARLGGDEFAILLPSLRTGADLGRVARKILDIFDEYFLLEGKEVFMSCSIGIALFPDDSANAPDLLTFADSAMHFAKRSGRNNFRFYAKNLTASALARLTMESELRRAIERHELELHYQPKISLQDGLLTGSEALLRWRHPENGLIPPDRFIPVAEDTWLILEIGQWVLREACRSAAEWNAPGAPPHKVAINLSARQFQSGDLVATVRQALEESDCQPEWIELEITESLLLDEDGQVLDILRAFRAMGISIAIDDFGTGYSALSYLARFPIDTLKIDRSFIKTLTTDNYRAELVRAILSIARCLGQQVVAEGVETEAQAMLLKTYGCQIAQGFLFSKAVPKADFPRDGKFAQALLSTPGFVS